MLELYAGAENFDMKLIIREWCQIAFEWEFRAFVFDGKLTAVTQYYSIVYVPELKEMEEQISKRIQDYWEGISILPFFLTFIFDYQRTEFRSQLTLLILLYLKIYRR